MNALYYIMEADGSQAGPYTHAQVVASLQQGGLRRESLIRRADLAEFFAIDSYPEFTQVAVTPVRAPVPVARAPVPRAAVAAAKPKAVATVKPPMTAGTKLFVWGMVLLWVVLIGWGVSAGWKKWQEGSEDEKRAEAEKWKKENLPAFTVTRLTKKFGKGWPDGSVEIVVEGEVEEKEAKRHPVYGRAERSEVWVRLAFSTELTGEIGSVQIEPQWVRVKDGKGSFLTIHIAQGDVIEQLARIWDRVKVEGRIKYEK